MGGLLARARALTRPLAVPPRPHYTEAWLKRVLGPGCPRFGAQLLWHCPVHAVTVSSQAPPRSQPTYRSLSLCSQTRSLPRSCARLWCGVRLDWGVSPFVLRRIARLQTPVHGSLHPDCWRASVCALLLESRLWQAFYLSGLPSRQGGLAPLHRTPRTVGTPRLWHVLLAPQDKDLSVWTFSSS